MSNFFEQMLMMQANEINIRKKLVHENVPAADGALFSVYENYDRFIVPELSEKEKVTPIILKKY